MGVASWDNPDADQGNELGDQGVGPQVPSAAPPTDAVRSWLLKGIHTFAVDPRRLIGRHGHAKRLLAEDHRSVEAPGIWRELGSALQRQTMHSGLSQLSAEHRSVVTLAYLEGQTNRQIAAALGVSVSTVRRRLWVALELLEEYTRRAGTWMLGVLLFGAMYVIDRASRIGRATNAVGASDWSHRLAATVAVGAVTTAAIGLVAASPDGSGVMHRSTPPTARAQSIAAGIGKVGVSPLILAPYAPSPTTVSPAAPVTLSGSGGGGDGTQVKVAVVKTSVAAPDVDRHSKRDCKGDHPDRQRGAAGERDDDRDGPPVKHCRDD